MNDDHPVTPTTAASQAIAGTARFIAASLLIASYDSRYSTLLSAEAGPLCRALLIAAGNRAFVRLAAVGLFRWLFLTFTQLVLPGIILHYLVRKRCLEDWLVAAVEAGCEQIVVLGAGLDTLGWRLHRRMPSINVIEIDRPAALRIKAQAMTGAWARSSNLTFLAADLASEPLATALPRHDAYKAHLPTAFVAEGLLMYLDAAQARSLLREVAAATDPSARTSLLAFTFMERRADGRIAFRRSNPFVNWWLRRSTETFRSSINPDHLADILEKDGWSLRELASADLLRERYLQPLGLAAAPQAVGEWLALAASKNQSWP